MEQIGSRADRMGLMDNGSIYIFSETRLEVCTHSPARPPAHPLTHRFTDFVLPQFQGLHSRCTLHAIPLWVHPMP